MDDILKDIHENPVRKAVERNIKELFKNQSIINGALFYTLCLDKILEPTFEYNKRMRPYLIWKGSNAAELKQDAIFGELATAVELVHQSTLPADDIQDNSDTRCGREALWKKAGINTTIDLILLLATSGPTYYAKILGGDKNGFLHNYSDFLQTTRINLVSGQELDLKADKGGKSINDYFNIVDGKTGALINLALHFGTMPYEYLYTKEKSEALTKFSMIFSRLYQIKDDIDDVVKGAKLDSSNIYYYVDQSPERLNDLWENLREELFNSYNELKEFGVVKNNKILDVINILIPEIIFE